MGRRENPVDPSAGPVARFAYALRKLRQEAGAPTYRAMARQVPYSVTALATAASGEKLPSLPVALAYVAACGGDAAEWEERWRDARRDEEEQAFAAQEETAAAPYRGLTRFEADDQDVFFGRARLTDDLLQLVHAHRVTAVFGPSGSGKSSLLRAGLLPRLRDTQDTALRPAAIRILTPGTRAVRDHERLFTPAQAPGETWLVVDQFEELFTLHSDAAEQAAFIDLLLTALEPGSRLRVVLGVRADFYSRCLEHEGLAAVIREASLPVGPMSPSELREAIVRPAAAAGLIVERVLTDRLIEEVSEEPGGLPLLSHALLETWRRRRGRTLSLQAYMAAGGIHGAIAQTAEDLYTRLTPAQAEAARHILLRLITPGDGTPDTRRPVDQNELADLDTTGATGRDPHTALYTLARARLITLDDDTVDLAHEALITAWPRLHRWIEDDRDQLRRHRRLTQAARHWHDRGRDSGALLRGTELNEIEHAFESPELRRDLTSLEREFLRTCTAAHARGRRLRHGVTGAVALLVTLALVAGAAAWQQSRTSEQRRTEVAARRVAAIAESMRSSDPVTAMRLSAAAWTLSGTTETRSALLGALSQQEQDVFEVPGTGLAPTSYLSRDGRTVVREEESSVRAWNAAEHRPAGPRHPLENGSVEAVSPDGRRMIVDSDDQLQLWNLRTGRAVGEPFGDVGSLHDFGPSGRTVLSAHPEGGVELWDLKRRRVLFEQPDSTASQLAISPDDRLLALCAKDGSPLQVRDVARHRELPAPWSGVRGLEVCGEGSSLEFTPDNRGLVVQPRSEIRVWDLAKGRERARIQHKGLTEAALSPDGAFVVATDGREILLWRWAAPKTPVLRVPLTNESATDLRFDVRAGAIRYVSDAGNTEMSVRTLAYGAAMTGAWSEEPAAQGMFSQDGSALAREQRHGDVSRFEVLRGTDGKRIARTPELHCAETDPLSGDDSCYTALALSPDGHTLAYGTAVINDSGMPAEPGQMTLWNVRKDARSHSLTRPGSADSEIAGMAGLAFTPDSRSLLVPGWDVDPTETWDVSRGTRRKQHPTRPRSDDSGAPQGMWDKNTLGSLSGRTPLAVRPDGHLLASASGQTVALPSGRATINDLVLPEIGAMAFSPDGKQLAVGKDTGRIALWDGDIEQRLGTFDGTYDAARPGAANTEAVTALAYSPDGSTLAVAGDHGTVRLWDIASRRPLGASLPTPGDSVIALAFSADGRTLHSAGEHSAPRSYAVDPKHIITSICARTNGGPSRTTWRKYIPEVPYRDIC
ncbi:hypothetical protein [Streptomyces formicae]|uniref:High-affnity carbon uptake protein Hat/HatR n=1 Tax=Streptomyces formicae TaxID=1616117 RepID=A0A291Q2Q3_9ACTN|nr:hypothetical protein [Streptomyces formicae]ATL26021.1 High-affnity carbon uptake protein Hat/HatR [Streptomyces formicae]